MNTELDALDDRVNQLVQLCQKLRKDNMELRQQVASSYSENKRLNEKIEAAKARLEALLKQVPEGAE